MLARRGLVVRVCGVSRVRWQQTSATGPRAAYERLVVEGRIQRDAIQESVMDRFERLHNELLESPKPASRPAPAARSWLSSLLGGGEEAAVEKSAKPAPRGLYVYGSTGSGKTFCMDVFYGNLEGVSETARQRVHFHEFMLSIHRRLHELKKRDKDESKPLRAVAAEVAAQGVLLCLDEMQVTDIADALVIKGLFEALWEAGCVVVATSNRAPDELYYNGIQRQLFEPFIPLLEAKCDVVSVHASKTDYRLVKGSGETARVYFVKAASEGGDDESDESDDFADCKARLLVDPELRDKVVLRTRDTGRRVEVPRADLAARAASFRFDELCGAALGAADYLAIARAFHVVFVDDVPVMDLGDLDRARRFITLIDALYDGDCVVVVRAAAPPDDLFVADKSNQSLTRDQQAKAARDEAFAFDRTVSRLVEMGSAEYLTRARASRPPLAIDVLRAEDDVDVDGLFHALDVDASGTLDAYELAAFLADVSELRRGHRNVPDAELKLALAQLDTNNDGLVDLPELRHYINNVAKGKPLFEDALPSSHHHHATSPSSS